MLSSGSRSSATRALRGLLPTSQIPIPSSSSLPLRSASSYYPNKSTSVSPPSRPPRPPTPSFFTGRPAYYDSLNHLSNTLTRAQSLLRAQFIYPLPSSLPYLQPPPVSWKAADQLHFKVAGGAGEYRKIVDVLNELHHLRFVAATAGSGDVATLLDTALKPYERGDVKMSGIEKEVSQGGKTKRDGIDELGRSYAMGRRKTSSARVWMVPVITSSTSSTEPESSTMTTPATTDSNSSTESPFPIAQILVNHLPLHSHFSRVTDRDLVLRPFRLTGLLGAYNVFALVRGGGTTGQAGAISLAIARALAQIKDDVRPVLENDGALMRDTRMVERKKTGLAKARKRYTWVKR